MVELGGVEVVVLDGVARAIEARVAQCGDGVECLQLYVDRHARREAIEIHLIGILPFGLEEQWVLLLAGKGDEFGLYRRAVARSGALYLPVEERRVCQSAAEYVVRLLVGITGPTRQLLQCAERSHITELMKSLFAGLLLCVFEVYTSSVDAYGCARLHTPYAYAVAGYALAEVQDSRLGASATRHLMLADVHESVEECACRHHHRAGMECYSPDGGNSHSHTVFDDECVCLVLPDIQIVGVVKYFAPFPDELSPVALRPWRPNGWAFSLIEHSELYGSGVGDDSGLTAESINLPDYLSFSYATDGRVTAHLSNLVHVHSNQARPSAHPGSCGSGFAACVSASDYYHIIIKFHYVVIFSAKVRN